MAVSDYDTTPGNNTAISGISIAEGCSPGNLNDATRQMMADIASWDADIPKAGGTESITGTWTFTAATITTATITGGAVSGANVTIGSGKTLDVSGGTLTLADDQIAGAKVATATDTTEGVVELSTTAENEAGTATDKVPTVAGVMEIVEENASPIIAAGEFDGTGTPAWTHRDAGFSATITDNGTGDYNVAFATAEPDANYIVLLSYGGTGIADGRAYLYARSKTTAGFRIEVVNTNDTFIDIPYIVVTVIRRAWV